LKRNNYFREQKKRKTMKETMRRHHLSNLEKKKTLVCEDPRGDQEPSPKDCPQQKPRTRGDDQGYPPKPLRGGQEVRPKKTEDDVNVTHEEKAERRKKRKGRTEKESSHRELLFSGGKGKKNRTGTKWEVEETVGGNEFKPHLGGDQGKRMEV